MERPVPVTSFFKVLAGDFSEKLKMPTAFANHFKGSALCKLQGPSGKFWDVKLEEKNNDIFFHTGWKKFMKDNFLDEGDFLVFDYDGDSCFNVTIYDESLCEMDMEVAELKRSGGGRRRYHIAPGESRIVEFNSENFCFMRIMEKSRLYQLTIPKKIVMGMKLDMRKHILKLRDPEKTSWPVTVHPRPDGRLLMRAGWCDCIKANRIEEGHTMVFEFFKGLVKLHIFRTKGCKKVILTGPKVVD